MRALSESILTQDIEQADAAVAATRILDWDDISRDVLRGVKKFDCGALVSTSTPSLTSLKLPETKYILYGTGRTITELLFVITNYKGVTDMLHWRHYSLKTIPYRLHPQLSTIQRHGLVPKEINEDLSIIIKDRHDNYICFSKQEPKDTKLKPFFKYQFTWDTPKTEDGFYVWFIIKPDFKKIL